MSFWRKLFGGGNSLAQMRLTLEQKRWADALNIGTDLEQAGVPPEEASELAALLAAAGNGLAELNLNEGEACLRAGDLARAAEHFGLAAGQARSTALQQRVQAAATGLQMGQKPVASQPASSSGDCHTGCISSCTVSGQDTANPVSEPELDAQTRVELIVASYPANLSDRYLQRSGSFRAAFLLAHEEHSKEALAAFEAVAAEERDDLFYFERGALLGRTGQTRPACSDLEKALEINPELFLAMETLVHLELDTGNESAAEARLQRMLTQNIAPGFCHGMLARILAGQGQMQAALEHGMQALAGGETNAETLLLTASLLEQTGQLDSAERVLMHLPGGGCSGGPSLPLAEFWLRNGKNLDKALESFKAALRSDAGNPRWLLRVAQVYLARGWKKEAVNLLEKVLNTDHLDAWLDAEATSLLDVARK